MNQPALDLRAYEEMKEIMEEVLPELLNTFIEYMPEQLNDLNHAIDDNNPDLLFGIAHRMKSSSNSLGALGLAKIAESIEMLGRAGNTEGAREKSAELEEQLNEVIAFFKEEQKTLT
ncbi:MAG: Hpt domain-containing protein [Gammaproteobacteria bacterium]|jgi:HPt (histidine-containing phosphotransfer) domain-containing protein|nr:Hpt domain-containing protein [Gammaproteobacteria bacterium]